MSTCTAILSLLWLCIIYHEKLQGIKNLGRSIMIARGGGGGALVMTVYVKMQLFTGGDAASYTNGFPNRFIYYVYFPAVPSTRIIPEMNFACSGTIVGYTAVLRGPPGHQGPIIQVWRKNTYYKTSADIAINDASCDGGLTNTSMEVFHCSLNLTTTRVTVKPGDILGLDLHVPDNGIRLAFASVISGPINYVFNERLPMYSISRELPQINLEVEPGKCMLDLSFGNFMHDIVDIQASTLVFLTSSSPQYF